MASIPYNIVKKQLGDADLDWLNDDIKIILVNNYTPDIDADEYYDDITDEISGTGYDAGGKSLSGKAVNRDDANDRTEFDAANITWPSATFVTAGAIVYKDTGTPSTSYLICYLDFLTVRSPVAEDMTITFDDQGLLQLG